MIKGKEIRAAVFGLAIGDAVGVPVEFTQPHIMAEHPIHDMHSGGTHGMPLGTWSDDTSLTLAAMDGLAESGDTPDYDKIMDNFTAWLYKAEYTATGEVFDVGSCCMQAIHNYHSKGVTPIKCGPKGEMDCGNGALMRIIPALFWCRQAYGEDFIKDPRALEIVHNLTALTHGHNRCLMASGIYISIANKILSGLKKSDAVKCGIEEACSVYRDLPEFEREFKHFERIADPDFEKLPREEIRSKGYVIDTLEAAIWCFLNTDSYRACIIKAVNLGHDTDTIAAVAGAIAGLYYSSAVSRDLAADWEGKLLEKDQILRICSRFAEKLEQLGRDA